jgi:hypothetical protein
VLRRLCIVYRTQQAARFFPSNVGDRISWMSWCSGSFAICHISRVAHFPTVLNAEQQVLQATTDGANIASIFTTTI